MKTAIGLTDKAKVETIAFFKRYHKNFNDWKFDTDAAVREVEETVCSSPNHEYELRGLETVDGSPVRLSFKDEDLIFGDDDSEKPTCELIGGDGNVFIIIGAVAKTLKRAKMHAAADEFTKKAFSAQSYDEVLTLAMDYVEIV